MSKTELLYEEDFIPNANVFENNPLDYLKHG